MRETNLWRFLPCRACGLSFLIASVLLAPPAMGQASQDAATPPVNEPASTTPAGSESEGLVKQIVEKPEIEILDSLGRIWHATLFTAGDQDIKLSQIVIALLIVLIGLLLAKRITRFFGKRLSSTKRVSEVVAETLGKILYYIAATIVVLIAMQVAGIPTTIFTVLGGALAIGVGFGAQNLFNNLISGLIILTEKPIRRNDIIEVDGMEGQVAEIGNRRTRIRMPTGIDVLVPNSTFLQNNVVNWTLSDSLVRGKVAIGVAYGSPVRTVRELLLKAAEQHGRIENSPPPVVLFTDFGDNALVFELYFWTRVTRPLDRRQIESDLRFKIDELFHDAKLVIAYPQRDVHLDTLRPLEVRMIKDNQQ